MSDLAEQSCQSCRKDSPRVSVTKLEQCLKQLRGWQIVTIDGVQRIKRTFAFEDFAQALAFTNKVGELAESENHHPAITTEWGKVTIWWWTHVIGGLHINDLILAARTDRLVD